MRKASACLLLCIAIPVSAQVPAAPTVPAQEALAHIIQTATLTDHGTPFHAVLVISPAKDKPSATKGTVEVFWQSADMYRTVVSSLDFKQVRIVHGDDIEEENTGDFYPLWLQNYVTALLNPLRLPNVWTHTSTPIRPGETMRSCLSRADKPGGITDDLTSTKICFSGAEPQLSSFSDFTYQMDFSEYKPFGSKNIARTYERSMDWTAPSVGHLTLLEPLAETDSSLFTISKVTPPADRIETMAVSTLKEESLVEKTDTSPWPPIRGGKTEGYMIVRAITDRTGQVRFAHPYNSDNAELEYAGVDRAMHYKFKPLILDGVPQQMEMPLVLHFVSHIDDPWPVITGKDIAKVTSGCGKATLQAGLWPKGKVFHIQYGVDQTGKVTTTSFPEANDDPGVPRELMSAAWGSLRSCRFFPYKENGKPTEYIAIFAFTAP